MRNLRTLGFLLARQAAVMAVAGEGTPNGHQHSTPQRVSYSCLTTLLIIFLKPHAPRCFDPGIVKVGCMSLHKMPAFKSILLCSSVLFPCVSLGFCCNYNICIGQHSQLYLEVRTAHSVKLQIMRNQESCCDCNKMHQTHARFN